MRSSSLRFIVFGAMAVLTACAAPRQTAEPLPSAPTAAQEAALQAVQGMYKAGRYGDVVREVARSQDLNEAPPALRVQAMKLRAFSYCLSKYRVLCQEEFGRILKIDPAFELSPTEQGHPLWGPAYRAARGQ
jgi:hypothetical protein